jgi:hypothetical protein
VCSSNACWWNRECRARDALAELASRLICSEPARLDLSHESSQPRIDHIPLSRLTMASHCEHVIGIQTQASRDLLTRGWARHLSAVRIFGQPLGHE